MTTANQSFRYLLNISTDIEIKFVPTTELVETVYLDKIKKSNT